MQHAVQQTAAPARERQSEQVAPGFDPIGRIEIEDEMLDVEIRVGAESSTNTWICHEGVCCNITCW